MTITTGTSHFVSKSAANRYYKAYGFTADDVWTKINDGEIHIGKPELKAGQKLTTIDGGTRYAVEG